jgi:hypothetical protein
MLTTLGWTDKHTQFVIQSGEHKNLVGTKIGYPRQWKMPVRLADGRIVNLGGRTLVKLQG